ncbi:DotH/IcmK family type IV secretion protein [Roseomonas mucosa]|uniref:DotH/IcmK family type IV secretion protein n=1 Tax=Roseomonas mucosa TaxID=207340 RepID=UPI0028CBC29B|nr:DotH/IcmK family type IV secretion protein [Roseomonas mucosa]MDT8278716.1 DotH/IcmK family type IV secretion protein [Roseomonas mucosa]
MHVRHAILGLAAGSMLAAAASAQAPPPPPPSPADRAATRDRILEDAIPLTPEMIRELARRYGEVRRAQEESVAIVAAPVSRPVNVGFQPGQPTSIIQTVRGYPTALSFFDNTGQPWPIAWDTNSNNANVSGGGGAGVGGCSTSPNAGPAGPGGPSADLTGFHVCVPVRGSNTIQITPMSVAPRGGLLVNLQGAPKPISFLLVAGQSRYDADVSVHVSNRGPNARIQIDTRPGAPVTGAPYLTAMLSGVAPADAVPLAVSGVSPDDVRAWRLGSQLYLRTRHTLLSPPWDASQYGEGGTTVYALPQTPVVLLSVNNRTVSAELREER